MKCHLVPTLQVTFQSVETFFYEGMGRWSDPGWVARRPQEMRRLMAAVRALRSVDRLHLIFMVAYDDFLFPSAAAEISRLGIRMINYHADMDSQWYRCIRTAPFFDLIGVATKHHFRDLERYGGKLLHVPMAANTDHFRPLNLPKEHDVLFVGTYSPPRADVLAAATDVAGSVCVAGNGWNPTSETPAPSTRRVHWKKYFHDLPYILPRLRAEGWGLLSTRNVGVRTYDKGGRTGGAVSLGRPDEIMPLLNKAKIVLGISQRHDSLGGERGLTKSCLRDFEAPACGVFYLVQRYPELAMHYVEDKEVVAWSTLDELRTKIRYYLTHEGERQAIAAAGRERVLRTHQWQQRYRALVDHLDLKR